MTNTNNPLVSSPEGAKLEVREELYDAANPNGAIIITVHEIDQSLVGNVWLKEGETYTKLITERVVKHEEQTETSALLFLKGEWFRYVCDNNEQKQNTRFKLSILGLQQTIRSLMTESKDKGFKSLPATGPEKVSEDNKIITLEKLLQRKNIGYLYINPKYLQYLMKSGIPRHGEVPLYAEAQGQHDAKDHPENWLLANVSLKNKLKEIFIYFPGIDLPITFEIVDRMSNYKIEKSAKSESSGFIC